MSREIQIREESLPRNFTLPGCVSSFRKGAIWADKTIIEKAYQWLSNNKDNYIIDIEGEIIVDAKIIEDFLKAMKLWKHFQN